MNDNDDDNDSKTDKVSGNHSDSHCGKLVMVTITVRGNDDGNLLR